MTAFDGCQNPSVPERWRELSEPPMTERRRAARTDSRHLLQKMKVASAAFFLLANVIVISGKYYITAQAFSQ